MTDILKVMEVMNRIGKPPAFSFTPSEVVYREGKTRLLHYLPKTAETAPVPVFLVPSLINKYYILDLLPTKSYVEFLVNRGFSVYLIDWGVPDDDDRAVGLDTYVGDYLKNSIRVVRKRENVKKVSLIGYCMGGTMALMYAALYPKTVENLILLATPVDFHNDSLLSLWAAEKYFDVDKMVDVYGNIPVSVMQSAFQLLKPVKTFTRYADLYENAENEAFVETFLAFDYWANDQIPVAGETFRKFVRDTFQRNLLIRNEMTLGGELIDLRRIKAPVLNVIAEHDNIVPPASAEALMPQISSREAEILKVRGGHHGITIGTSAQRIVWGRTADWMIEKSS
ncbi:MAG: alpha/beta fold hydrolase [Acidobacteria bacterium]|nr:alpha/beta fold hydrolase [Acidobacteriota bacterium]